MATAQKHKLRSKRSNRGEEQRKSLYFGHCMLFQMETKKNKEAWKKA